MLMQGIWAILLTVVATALILVPAPAAPVQLPGPVLAAWSKLNKTPLYDVSSRT